MFLSLAFVFAGVNNALGQVQLNPGITTTQPIDPLSCADGTDPLPLHPYPGVPYTYTMDGTTGDENADEWTWFATKDPNFIVDGVLNTTNALAVGAGSPILAATNYNTPSGTNSVTITWSAEILAATQYQGDATNWATASSANPTPTFVVGYATGVNCADNIQVYEINPEFNFTLDIAAIDPDGNTLDWDVANLICVDDVWEAIYNSGTNELDMDYGTNTILFEVAAANFVEDFTPTFRLISGLQGDQEAVVTLHATLADAEAGTNSEGTVTWTNANIDGDWATGIQFTATDPNNVAGGVSLYVRVVISNNTYESLTSNPFVLAVDAIDDTENGIWDMEDDDCDPATAADEADQADQAEHTIDPRPTIIHNTPDAAPAPDDVIEKTEN